jgi:hypothetical protein
VGDRLDEARRGHPDYLALGAGRISQWPQQIENRTETQLLPDRRDVFHRPVVGLGEQEADAGLVQRLALPVEARIDVDAQRRQHVGGAGFGGDRPVAVLGDLQSATRRHEPDGRGDVQRMQAVAAGAADVDRLVGQVQVHRGAAHGPAQATISPTVSPRRRMAVTAAATWAGVGSPRRQAPKKASASSSDRVAPSARRLSRGLKASDTA